MPTFHRLANHHQLRYSLSITLCVIFDGVTEHSRERTSTSETTPRTRYRSARHQYRHRGSGSDCEHNSSFDHSFECGICNGYWDAVLVATDHLGIRTTRYRGRSRRYSKTGFIQMLEALRRTSPFDCRSRRVNSGHGTIVITRPPFTRMAAHR